MDQGLSGTRVLVVDDEAVEVLLLSDTLEKAGAEVLAATSVEKAMQLLANGGDFHAAILGTAVAGEGIGPVTDALAERRVPFIISLGESGELLLDQHQSTPALRRPYNSVDLVE